MKVNKLKAKMVEFGDTQADLAMALALAPVSISRKVNGQSEWTYAELVLIKHRYQLTSQEFDDIFFSQDLS